MSRSRRRPKGTTLISPAAPAPASPPDPVIVASTPAASPSLTPTQTPRRLTDGVLVAIAILAGTILRLAIAPWGRYWEDSQVLAFRAVRLALLPPSQLYQTNQGVIGHLPGDLWLLWFLSNAFRSLQPDGNFYGDTFLYMTKLVPIAADAGAAIALTLIARHIAGARAGLIAGAIYAFNPGVIVIASLWDQWDSLSTCAALFAILFLLRRRFELSAAFLSYACLVKPQFALFGLLFAVVYLRRELLPNLRRDRWAAGVAAMRAGACLLVAWVTAEIVLLPFNVSIWPLTTEFTLQDRLRYAFRVHDEVTLNAFNIWATPLAGNAIEDSAVSFLGIGSRTWGQALFGIAIAAILALWWRSGSDRALVWASFALVFSSFMLPTRIHERYFFPTAALAILFVALRPRLAPFTVLVTAVFTANIVAVYVMAHDQRGAPFFSKHDPWMTLAAFVNIALLIWTFGWGLRALERANGAAFQWRFNRRT